MKHTPEAVKKLSCVNLPQHPQARMEKLRGLILNTNAIENGLTLPDFPSRYVAVEQNTFGDTMWAYLEDSMAGIMKSLEASETSFVERIRIHDLDTNQVYALQWKIHQFYEVLN